MQELIYYDIDSDLSACRIKLNNAWHVMVIGEKPLDSLHVEIEAQLTDVLVTVEAEMLLYLMARRGQAIQLGPWVEAHYPTKEE